MTSCPIELLISLTRDGGRRLSAQIEDQMRQAIREGTLRPGTLLPSTRDLARQLGISRPIVVDAYAQLAAEGYLTVRQGARARVSALATPPRATTVAGTMDQAPPWKFDFRPMVPDLASFPRGSWLKALRIALAKMSDDDLGYDERHGSRVLRLALADYLGRVRGVVADPESVVVANGFAQARGLLPRALRAVGARRVAVEDPSYTVWEPFRRAGLDLLPIAVDAAGMRVEELERVDADAVMLTPAHQFPTGGVMSGERRLRLLNWLCRREAIAIEDDYDAEFRYDREPIRALQGLDPDRVVYIGTASKTLAPALRLGWLVVPKRLLQAVESEQGLADFGCPRIEQHALAEFITSGEFDRHLRRMRVRYRVRRDALLAALATELPEATVEGIAAGLHATVRLPARLDEHAIREQAQRRAIALVFMSEHRVFSRSSVPTLLLGYARSPEATIAAGVRSLAAAIRAAEGRRS